MLRLQNSIIFLYLFSSQKCDHFRNIRRFFVILFAYIKKNTTFAGKNEHFVIIK